MRSLRTHARSRFALLVCLVCANASAPGAALAEVPASLVAEALSVDVPTAFAPADFAVADFAVERLSGDATVQATLVEGSLRWVRVAHYVVVPRALVVVSTPSARGGTVRYAGLTHPLAIGASAGPARAQVPVALFSGGAHPLYVELSGEPGQPPRTATFALRFAPRPAQRGRVLFDSSCSPYGLRVERGAVPADSFLHVGCRVVRTAREDDTAATLELYALWEQAGPMVNVAGVPTAPVSDALFTFRVSAEPGRVRLAARGHAVVLRYALPDPLHAGFLGAGVGPYYYRYRDGSVDLETAIPLLTLYASYAFTPAIRIVYFNAAAIHKRGSIDQGLYVWFEQVRMLDERVSLNLLLGANALVYARGDGVHGRLSVPQGFEFIVRDLFGRNRTLTAGAFLYPKLSDRAYYNAWLRWGSPSLFGELNYIEWEEPHGEGSTRSRAFGISFGTPVLRFL